MSKLIQNRWQSITLMQSTNADQKPLETVIFDSNFDNFVPLNSFMMDFDPHSLIVKRVFDCCISDVTLFK